MSENSPASDFNPFSGGGQDPQTVAYKWGATVKAYKGANIDYTVGIKSSTTIGGSNTNVLGIGSLAFYTPFYCAIVVGQAYSNYVGSYHSRTYKLLPVFSGDSFSTIEGDYTQTIDGKATKKVSGGEDVHGVGDKIERYDADCYKFIKGTEYKVEDKGRNQFNPDNGVFVTNMRQKFTANATNTTQNNENIIVGKIQNHQVGSFTSQVVNDSTVTVGGNSRETVTGTKAIGSTGALTLSSTGTATLSAGNGTVTCQPGSVRIGPTADLGVPMATQAALNLAVNNLQQQLAQAQADAQAARQRAIAAEQRAIAAQTAAQNARANMRAKILSALLG